MLRTKIVDRFPSDMDWWKWNPMARIIWRYEHVNMIYKDKIVIDGMTSINIILGRLIRRVEEKKNYQIKVDGA